MGISRRGEPNRRFTYEDYKRVTATTDERYELLDGDLYVVPAPTTTHQIVSKDLQYLLERHVRATGGLLLDAPVDVVFGKADKRSVLQPDLLYISQERLGIVTEAEVVGAPDLVVEILSPSSAARDRRRKKALYARTGVREYWIVDPGLEAIEVYRLGPAGYGEPMRFGPGDRLLSTVLAGFEAPLEEVFRTR